MSAIAKNILFIDLGHIPAVVNQVARAAWSTRRRATSAGCPVENPIEQSERCTPILLENAPFLICPPLPRNDWLRKILPKKHQERESKLRERCLKSTHKIVAGSRSMTTERAKFSLPLFISVQRAASAFCTGAPGKQDKKKDRRRRGPRDSFTSCQVSFCLEPPRPVALPPRQSTLAAHPGRLSITRRAPAARRSSERHASRPRLSPHAITPRAPLVHEANMHGVPQQHPRRARLSTRRQGKEPVEWHVMRNAYGNRQEEKGKMSKGASAKEEI